MRQTKQRVAALALAFGVGGAGPVLAGDAEVGIYGDEIADPEDALATEEVTDADLRGFLEAAEAIEGIRAEYVEQILAADAADRAGLQQQANEAMLEAIDEAGIDPEVYQSIGYLIGEEDEMADRLDEAAEERDSEQ